MTTGNESGAVSVRRPGMVSGSGFAVIVGIALAAGLPGASASTTCPTQAASITNLTMHVVNNLDVPIQIESASGACTDFSGPDIPQKYVNRLFPPASMGAAHTSMLLVRRDKRAVKGWSTNRWQWSFITQRGGQPVGSFNLEWSRYVTSSRPARLRVANTSGSGKTVVPGSGAVWFTSGRIGNRDVRVAAHVRSGTDMTLEFAYAP